VLYGMATLPITLSDPQPPQTTTISTFCVVFYIFVAGNHTDFKLVMWVKHSKQLQTTNRLWNGRGHVTWSSLNFKAPNHISGITRGVARFQWLGVQLQGPSTECACAHRMRLRIRARPTAALGRVREGVAPSRYVGSGVMGYYPGENF